MTRYLAVTLLALASAATAVHAGDIETDYVQAEFVDREPLNVLKETGNYSAGSEKPLQRSYQRNGVYIHNDELFPTQAHFADYGDTDYQGGSGIGSALEKTVVNKTIRIAVLDGGFWRHPDISYNEDEAITVTETLYQAYTDEGEVNGSRNEYNWVFMEDYPEDDGHLYPNNGFCESDHGTVVLGQIDAITDNFTGVAGVANFDVIPIRIGNCGDRSDMKKGMLAALGVARGDYPVLSESVDIISLSAVDKGGCDEDFREIVELATSMGVAIVAGAGNSNGDMMGILNPRDDEDIVHEYAPASCDGVISVGATDEQGHVAHFSNWGDEITVSAFGLKVPSATKRDGEYGRVSGTSISTPIVAAIVGLAMQKYPDVPLEDLIALLKSTAKPVTEGYRLYLDPETGITHNYGNECFGYTCTTGIADANGLLDALDSLYGANDIEMDSAITAQHRLDSKDLYDFFYDSNELCEREVVQVPESMQGYDGYVEVYEVAAGGSLTASDNTSIGSYRESKFVLPTLDNATDYAYRLCADSVGCYTDDLKVIIDNNSDLPATCGS